MTYPATNFNEAVELIVSDSTTLHQVINGSTLDIVTLPSGDSIPTLRRAIADSLLFKDPAPWDEGSYEVNFLQLRTFTDGLIYWAPTATESNPILMTTTPIGDLSWKLAPIVITVNSVNNKTGDIVLVASDFDDIYSKSEIDNALYNLSQSISYQTPVYDPTTVYSYGDVVYKNIGGIKKFFQWYSNVESLAGKDPENDANRRTGWVDNTKPFYWLPYSPKMAGETIYWDTDSVPENMVVGIGQQLPIAVYHSLATAKPEWIDAIDNSLINIPDRQGRFVRAADGSTWLAGETHDDAIRNITGSFGRVINIGSTESSGAFSWSSLQSTAPISESSGASSTRYAYFDASLVVPTSNENQPKAYIEWVGYAL